MKKIPIAAVSSLALLAVWLYPAKEAKAIPAWARKYNADCSMCHTMNPRLNAMGHKFRRLGYKLPDEFDSAETKINAEELAKFTNYFGARGRPRIVYGKTPGATTNFDLQMHDVTLFYTGSVARNAGFFFELPFEPSAGNAFLEVGQILLNFGESDKFFFMRLGQMHQFSGVGFGGLDRGIALSRPSAVSTRINGFRLQHDGAAVEMGGSINNFTGLVQVSNGITAAGGSVLNDNDPNKAKDVGVLLEYMLPEHDGSVSALYINGRAPVPQNNAATNITGAGNAQYNRFYLFADYFFDTIGLKPLIGGSYGVDNQFINGIGTATAALITAANSASWSAFAELDQKVTGDLYLVGRFDYIEPTDMAEAASGTRRTWTGTSAFVWQFLDYFRTTLEYQATDNAARNLGHSVTGELQIVF
ncbi:MAG: hypothetical protein HY466_01405 [Deltaproteobacteria bacterium]|nr:hypothetical protein [Deltaproteobacteria bacterium]